MNEHPRATSCTGKPVTLILFIKIFMNMFKFNFNSEVDKNPIDIAQSNKICWYSSKEIHIPTNVSDVIKTISRNQIINVDCGYGISCFCLSVKEVMNILKEKSDNDEFMDVVNADKEHSDLLPGKYEGGLKTWECTKDLATYIMTNIIKGESNYLKGKQILDLGCGSGILGILCVMFGGNVTFQDYNQEVLEAMTIPNIFLNCNESVKERVKCYSGDWSSFLDLLVSDNDKTDSVKFDFILTSETIYNPENYYKIIRILKTLLKPEGMGLVAAKSHYFGVGGSIFEFQKELQKNGLNSLVCWETTSCVNRQILKIQL